MRGWGGWVQHIKGVHYLPSTHILPVRVCRRKSCKDGWGKTLEGYQSLKARALTAPELRCAGSRGQLRRKQGAKARHVVSSDRLETLESELRRAWERCLSSIARLCRSAPLVIWPRR